MQHLEAVNAVAVRYGFAPQEPGCWLTEGENYWHGLKLEENTLTLTEYYRRDRFEDWQKDVVLQADTENITEDELLAEFERLFLYRL